MTNISYYPRAAWRPGNEALHITTSASPAEAISHTSALGIALYGAADTLDIATYPAEQGVVFEGSVAKIDKQRDQLVRIAPEIALRALNECEYGRDSTGGIAHLSGLVSRFGAPLQDNDSFAGRIKSSVGPFAQETTWDGCFEHQYTQPYKAPLDHRINEIIGKLRWNHDTAVEMSEQAVTFPADLNEVLRALAKIDELNVQQEIVAALRYYGAIRLDDPDLAMKIHIHHSLAKAPSHRRGTRY